MERRPDPWVIIQRRHIQEQMRLHRALVHQVRAAPGAEAAELPWGRLVGAHLFRA